MTPQECFQLPDISLVAKLSNTVEDSGALPQDTLRNNIFISPRKKKPSATPLGKSARHAFCWCEDRKPCNL